MMVADFSVRAHRFLMYISSLDFPFRVFGFCRGFAFKFNLAPFAATACHSDFGRSLARHAMVCLTLCCIANFSASALETLVMAQQQLTFCRTTALMAPKILPRPKAGTLPPSIQRPTVAMAWHLGTLFPTLILAVIPTGYRLNFWFSFCSLEGRLSNFGPGPSLQELCA